MDEFRNNYCFAYKNQIIQIKTKQRTKMKYFICKFEEYMTTEGFRG
jgi:hypothetical protein